MSMILEKPQAEPATLSVEDVQQFLYREARFLDDKVRATAKKYRRLSQL